MNLLRIVGNVFGLIALILMIPAQSAFGKSGVPADAVSSGVDWKRIERKLDVSAVESANGIAYAGVILGKANQEPSVTWLAVTKSEAGSWETLYIDLNGDFKLTKEEKFAAPKPKKAGGNVTFTMAKLKIGKSTHTKFRLMITGDPLARGFYLMFNVDGDPKKFMRAGWHPTKGKQCRMHSDLKDAPIIDFVVAGNVHILGDPPVLSTKGDGLVAFSLATEGSRPEAVALIGMRRVPLQDFDVEMTYTTANGEKETIKDKANYFC